MDIDSKSDSSLLIIDENERSHSLAHASEPKTKKYKLNDTDSSLNKKRKLTPLQPVEYLPCDICNDRVYNYVRCINHFTYCSHDCYSILMLTYYNERPSFYDYYEHFIEDWDST